MQASLTARFFLPGWYGVGSALEELKKSDETAWDELVNGLSNWPNLYYLFANVETTIQSANEALFERYASLVEDNALRERFLVPIREENFEAGDGRRS